MSKKHEKNYETDKKHQKHTSGGSYPRLPIFPGLFPGITLNVKTLHLHLDEHMESTSFYHNGSCRCDDEDSVVVDLDEMDGKIAEQTGVDQQTVRKVLTAVDAYLTELGICETVEVEEVPDDKESLKEADEESQEGEVADDDQSAEKQEEPAESEVSDDEQ